MLKVENICFAYGQKEILKDISFHVEKGDCLVILGYNGAGKSTLLKTINHILKPHSGEILIGEKNLNEMKPIDIARHIAYVPQSISFYDASVFDTVLLGRKPYMSYHYSDNDLRATHQVILDFNLSDIAFEDMTKLSGGQRQKVAIARAINQQTDILLLDEPTANLDLKNQLELVAFMKKIAKENQKILIVTMHDINLALSFGTHFLFLKNQKIYQYGNKDMITKALVDDVYDVNVDIINHNSQKRILTI